MDSLNNILLYTENLTKNFQGIKAVNDINFSVYEGETLSILGHISGDGVLTLTCQDNQYKATLNYEKEY